MTVCTIMPSIILCTFSLTIGCHNMPPSRQICKLCGHVSVIGFYVPDKIWNDVVPGFYRDQELCLSCFARLADEKLIPWDEYIEIVPPESLYSHIKYLQEKGFIDKDYFLNGKDYFTGEDYSTIKD